MLLDFVYLMVVAGGLTKPAAIKELKAGHCTASLVEEAGDVTILAALTAQ